MSFEINTAEIVERHLQTVGYTGADSDALRSGDEDEKKAALSKHYAVADGACREVLLEFAKAEKIKKRTVEKLLAALDRYLHVIRVGVNLTSLVRPEPRDIRRLFSDALQVQKGGKVRKILSDELGEQHVAEKIKWLRDSRATSHEIASQLSEYQHGEKHRAILNTLQPYVNLMDTVRPIHLARFRALIGQEKARKLNGLIHTVFRDLRPMERSMRGIRVRPMPQF